MLRLFFRLYSVPLLEDKVGVLGWKDN
jgi:hypothetical protein